MEKSDNFLQGYEPTETEIQSAICKYLEVVPNIFFWRQNTQGTYDPRSGRWRKSKSPGVSDILMVHKGKLYCFEVKKNSKSPVRDSQVTFRQNIERVEGKYYIVWSVEMVQDIIKEIIK